MVFCSLYYVYGVLLIFDSQKAIVKTYGDVFQVLSYLNFKAQGYVFVLICCISVCSFLSLINGIWYIIFVSILISSDKKSFS